MAWGRVVIDTNVLVSAALKRLGAEAAIIDLVSSVVLQLCVSEPILAEYRSVLSRPKLRIEPSVLADFVELTHSRAIVVRPSTRLSISPDESDNRFLECAEAAHAEFLVTGNKRHFPARWKKTEIVNARELLAKLPR